MYFKVCRTVLAGESAMDICLVFAKELLEEADVCITNTVQELMGIIENWLISWSQTEGAQFLCLCLTHGPEQVT